MPPRLGILAALLLGIVAGPVAGAGAQSEPRDPSRKTVEDSELLWATVNICDTAKHPDTIGIRGSMPGSRDGREKMYMRFQVQYFTPADDRWHHIAQRWRLRLRPRRARKLRRTSVRPHLPLRAPAGSVLLRGVVTFEWRREGEVVRRARKRTTAGHRSTAGADPASYSASNCTIRA